MVEIDELEQMFKKIESTIRRTNELKRAINQMLDTLILEMYFRLRDLGVENFEVEYGGYIFDLAYKTFRRPEDKESKPIDSDLEVLRFFLENFNEIKQKKLNEVKTWLEEQLKSIELEHNKIKRMYDLVKSYIR